MTATPYSDQWRAHTAARMQLLGIDADDVCERTELAWPIVDAALHGSGPLVLEHVGPIDDLLHDLTEQAETATLRRAARSLAVAEPRPIVVHPGELVPVLGYVPETLADCAVALDIEAVRRLGQDGAA